MLCCNIRKFPYSRPYQSRLQFDLPGPMPSNFVPGNEPIPPCPPSNPPVAHFAKTIIPLVVTTPLSNYQPFVFFRSGLGRLLPVTFVHTAPSHVALVALHVGLIVANPTRMWSIPDTTSWTRSVNQHGTSSLACRRKQRLGGSSLSIPGSIHHVRQSTQRMHILHRHRRVSLVGVSVQGRLSILP